MKLKDIEMSRLWVFGDSFSSEVDMLNLHNNHKQYLEITKQTNFISWAKLLSNKLNLELKNLSKGGDSNYQTFQTFNDVCHLINENDIVIIGWGLVGKFRLSNKNEFVNIHPNDSMNLDMISKQTIDEIINNRLIDTKKSNLPDLWAKEVYGWEKLIHTLSLHKKFKVFFWSTEEPRLIYCEDDSFKKQRNYLCSKSDKCLVYYLKENGCLTISDETNNQVSDHHFGNKGNEMIANIFYNEII